MKLYYRESGKGQPMILLHGNGEDGAYFEEQIHYFSKRYRVIAIDTRGHGRSPRGTLPFTLGQFAEDLKEFLDGKKLKKVILLGFSDGGNIAVIFALRYPQYVDRMILNGANLTPFGVKAGVQALVVAGYGLCHICGAVNRVLKRPPNWPVNAEKPPEKPSKGQVMRAAAPVNTGERERYKGSLEQKTDLLGLMVKGPWIHQNELSRLKMPVLVIAGTDDMIKESHTRRICRSLPDGRLKLIEGNHFIALENSAEFNRAVASFLKKTEGSRTAIMKRLWSHRHPGRLDQEQGIDTAVLVPLLKKEGEYHILLEVRSDILKSQPGEVCFPGGAVEAGETKKEAAERETMEELGIYNSQIEMIAPLDVLITPANLSVYPFLALLKDYRGTYSSQEVDHTFTVPLKWLLEHEPERYQTDVVTEPGEDFPFDLIPGGEEYHWRKGKYDVLFYRYENTVIWGMTAKILHSFIKMYKRDMKQYIKWR